MKKFFILIYAALSCCSCQRVLYTPNKINAPGLTKAGEAKISTSAWLVPLSYTADLAMAPTDHLVIIGSYTRMHNIQHTE